jgi:hypothetical protein
MGAPGHEGSQWHQRQGREELRDAGFSEADIFTMTAYVALCVALSTVNDALGASPDAEYRTLAPAPVRDAVTFGRPIYASPQPPR